MTGLLIGGMIGLGIGLFFAVVMDFEHLFHNVATVVGAALIFGGIGTIFSFVPDEHRCEKPAVYVSTPSIKGCMQPHQLENIDPEMLKR